MSQRRINVAGTSKVNHIPPPPGPDVSWEKQAAYFEKYSWAQLEAAGYGRDLTAKEKREFKQLEKLVKAHLAEHKRASRKDS